MNTTRRPRVNLKARTVLVHCASLGSFHLYHITKTGTVSASPGERITVADTPRDACKALDVPYAPFEAVNGILHLRFRDAKTQVEAIWKAAITQRQQA